MAGLSSKLKSPWVLMLGATLLAGGIAYVAYLYLVQREASIKQEAASRAMRLQGPKAAVVVPRADAKAGTPVELDTPAIVATQEQIFARWTAAESLP